MKKGYKYLMLSSAALIFFATPKQDVFKNLDSISVHAQTNDEWTLKDEKGKFELKEDSSAKKEPRISQNEESNSDNNNEFKKGTVIDYDKIVEFDGYKWISFKNEDNERLFISIEKIEASKTNTSTSDSSTDSSKDEEVISKSESSEESLKEEVKSSTKNVENNKDSVEQKSSDTTTQSSDTKLSDVEDALTSISDYSSIKESKYRLASITPWKVVTEYGRYTFTEDCEIRDAPTKDSNFVTIYPEGGSVNYDSKIDNDGFKWLGYKTNSGRRLYVKIGKSSTPTNPNSNMGPAFDPNTAGQINYLTHVQNDGWQNWVKDGEMAGTQGRSLRMEAFKLELGNLPYDGSVEYRAHVQNDGWQNWVGPNSYAGTQGRSLRMEALEIRLTGELAKYYDVQYRAHVQNNGWMSWVKNGELAGTQGQSLRMEALEIKLVKKPGVNNPSDSSWKLISEKGSYKFNKKSEIKNEPKKSSTTVGYYNAGESVAYDSKVNYDNATWISYIAASGKRRYVQIATNSDITPKPDDSTEFDINNAGNINYLAHVQNYGWQNWVKDGDVAGTQGKELRMEAFKILLADRPYNGSIKYRAHVQDVGWQEWCGEGEIAGTRGRSLRIEALKISLTGELAKHYDVEYRSHVQGIGWQPWVKNGELAGTEGRSLRMEAIQIRLVKK
ncbi:hypothetical protein BG262_02070 [Floricoccus penangensis]|uniref:SH3b domain-containing protein n=1 Tax=Floricoccus penangensis TaxID=1859475 RepID=A0A9Q5NZN4_9LACT|nr:SH3 domain-containing protein [Floricoccus penangensis]OFI46612.1 hypothetical protein BG262_02070 [Floricoccus penangensis]